MVNLRWWFIFCMSAFSLAAGFHFDWLKQMWILDVTHLSTITLVVYFCVSAYIGYLTYRCNNADFEYVQPRVPGCWFISDLLMAFGMLGTIIGYLVMLHQGFGGEHAQEQLKMTQENVGQLLTGLSTVGITTAIGLACSQLMKLQLVNLEYMLEVHEQLENSRTDMMIEDLIRLRKNRGSRDA